MSSKLKCRARRSSIFLAAAALTLAIARWTATPALTAQSEAATEGVPKYVFLFLADGGGIPHMEITRQYNRVIHDEGMVIADRIMKEGVLGLMATHAADSLTTDSAAAATALASGCKAKIGSLGICADGTVPKTAMEIARENGMRLGLVTNATVYDASPAAFLSHVPSRRDYTAIVNRYLEIAPDVLLGGGRDYFLPRSQPGSRRKDDSDMIAAFVKKGYRAAHDKQHLEAARDGKLLGLFSLADMSFELDRDAHVEPSVCDMTRAAIRLLGDRNPGGFFLFVENENIDTAGHLSDVASLLRDYREFDRAIGLAYEFYKQHPRDTLIIVTSDHETGGLGFTMALRDPGPATGRIQTAATVEDLRKIHSIPISLRKASAILGPAPTAEAIGKLMLAYFPGFTLAPDIREAILKRQPLSRTFYVDATANALGAMVANNTQAYWQTSSHTNHPVFVAALGAGAEKFKGYQDNVEFGKSLRAILEQKKGVALPARAEPAAR